MERNYVYTMSQLIVEKSKLVCDMVQIVCVGHKVCRKYIVQQD